MDVDQSAVTTVYLFKQKKKKRNAVKNKNHYRNELQYKSIQFEIFDQALRLIRLFEKKFSKINPYYY